MSSLALRARRGAFQIEEEGDDVILFFCQGALRALQSVVEDEKKLFCPGGDGWRQSKKPDRRPRSRFWLPRRGCESAYEEGQHT